MAYFGKGASRLLPLPKGSRLVVDASIHAVTSGQTCPAELLILIKRGIEIYSVPNLHAKVFVLGKSAFIGSNNVSSHSAHTLIEAMICTNDSAIIKAARRFVMDKRLHRLTPELLKELDKKYRPPSIPGSKSGKRRRTGTNPESDLPRVLLAQLQLLEDWPDQEQSMHDDGMAIAKERSEHPRTYELDSFRYTGKCPFKRRDVVLQVTDEGSGNILVTAPGNVLNVKARQMGNTWVSYVYVEHPRVKPRQVNKLAKSLGRGSLKKLRRNGMVQSKSLARALLKIWST